MSAAAAAQAGAAGYHRARGGEDERGGSWGTGTWSAQRGDADEDGDDDDDEDEVSWSASEQACLRKSVKENGLDDWTLGDWSEVRKQPTVVRCGRGYSFYFCESLLFGSCCSSCLLVISHVYAAVGAKYRVLVRACRTRYILFRITCGIFFCCTRTDSYTYRSYV